MHLLENVEPFEFLEEGERKDFLPAFVLVDEIGHKPEEVIKNFEVYGWVVPDMTPEVIRVCDAFYPQKEIRYEDLNTETTATMNFTERCWWTDWEFVTTEYFKIDAKYYGEGEPI